MSKHPPRRPDVRVAIKYYGIVDSAGARNNIPNTSKNKFIATVKLPCCVIDNIFSHKKLVTPISLLLIN
jgi:hypothetical protein